MIIADSNLIAYLYLPGPKASIADAVFTKDPEWIVPPLWQSEFRNILFAYMRTQGMDLNTAENHWSHALEFLGTTQADPNPQHVLAKAAATKLRAYDAEYVVLAEQLKIPLVTSDKEILKSCPGLAITPEAFLKI